VIRVFNHWFPSNTVVQIVFDLLMLFCSMTIAVEWLNRDRLPIRDTAVLSAVLFAFTMLALNAVLGFYSRRSEHNLQTTLGRAVASVLLAVPVAYGVLHLLPSEGIANEAVVLGAVLSLGLMVCARAYAMHRGIGPTLVRRVMIIGTGSEAAAIEHSLRFRGNEVEVVGFYPAVSNGEQHVPAAAILPQDLSLADTARKLKISEIIVAVRERRGGAMPLDALLECKLAGVRVLDQSTYFERCLKQIHLESLKASWLIFGEGFRQGFVRTMVKRMFDIAASLMLLVVASPVMLVTAILIACESGFPIFYRQERVGQVGRTFNITKFRSMRTDAEQDGKPRWADTKDSRVTRVGRFIRTYRIDELPQLWNVLKGDMSLVGPRPERPYFVDSLTREIPFYAARHSLKPGLTGWAQVRHQYSASVEDAAKKLQYDLYYVKNHTLFLDVIVLLESVRVVVTGAGAQ
jgi:sugar transferase (PEP-CTERM system associated)